MTYYVIQNKYGEVTEVGILEEENEFLDLILECKSKDQVCGKISEEYYYELKKQIKEQQAPKETEAPEPTYGFSFQYHNPEDMDDDYLTDQEKKKLLVIEAISRSAKTEWGRLDEIYKWLIS